MISKERLLFLRKEDCYKRIDKKIQHVNYELDKLNTIYNSSNPEIANKILFLKKKLKYLIDRFYKVGQAKQNEYKY